MLRRVGLVRTDVTVKHLAPIIRLTQLASRENVSSNSSYTSILRLNVAPQVYCE
jgi:hypothetical protein